jgi:hypothetical protein
MFLESCFVVNSAVEKNKVLVIEEKEDVSLPWFVVHSKLENF